MKYMKSLMLITGLLVGGFFIYQKENLIIQEDQKVVQGNQKIDYSTIKDGDLIFHTSKSAQSKAIQLATHSQYSHCGILYREGNEIMVFEAVQPVKKTPLEKWILRGEEGKFVIKRLKDAETILNESVLKKMKQIGQSFTGKNYDSTFEWSDKELYCSELIWKIYKRATGIEIGKLQKLSDFDLQSEIVQKALKKRYENTLPLEETVISPESIFCSSKLEVVITNY